MSDKATRAWNLIEENLESLDTFEQKQKFLLGHKYISKAMDKVPGFKEKVNSYMIENIVSEFGNPDAPGFTFSKKYSDEFLLDKLNLIKKNKEVFEDYFGGEKGLKELEAKKLEGDVQYKEADEKINNLRQAIMQKRREFDVRTDWSSGPGEDNFFIKSWKQTMGIHPMSLVTAIGRIGGIPINLAEWAGLAKEGMEVAENRKFNWDPINKRYGPGPEIPALQEELGRAYELRNNTIPTQYSEQTEKYKEYKDMVLSNEHNRAIINATGIDEALNYLDAESLNLMLQGN